MLFNSKSRSTCTDFCEEPQTLKVASGVAALIFATGCLANQPNDNVSVGVPTIAEVVDVTETVTEMPTIAEQTETLKPIVPVTPGLRLRGQEITDHRVVKRWGPDKMVFTTTEEAPGYYKTWKNMVWAFVCDELVDGVDGEVPNHVSFYWHGDDSNKWLKRNPDLIAKMAKEIRQDTCWIAVHRPHSRIDGHKRSNDEMRYHLAVVDYFINTFGINQFDVYGSSGGGTVAAAVLQERRQHVRFAGLASPILAVKSMAPNVGHWRVYDPHYHMKRLLFRTPGMPEVCLLTVWDRNDRMVPSKGILPYFDEARELGLGEDRVRLVLVRSNDRLRHSTSHRNLGREIRKLRRSGDFCV